MKYGFVIDNRKCIGCHACTVACKSEHDVAIGVNRTWVKQVEKGEYPNTRRLFSVMRCNHCTDAPCVEICPTQALFIREDGIVDFDNNRCIGCKSCMQACPYDALYIDPNTETAAKCNYCAHRIDIGLEPACVNVCPEHAIISGDMEDPNSEIAELLARQQVKVRKPEKGTKPNLFYIDADDASLIPTATEQPDQYFWNSQERGVGHFAKFVEKRTAEVDIRDMVAKLEGREAAKTTVPKSIDVLLQKDRKVYDAPDKGLLWGWEVSAYIITKAIAAGIFILLFAAQMLSIQVSKEWMLIGGCLSLVFLTITGLLLVKDLDQPKRFLYVLLRPQWKSWLVKGAYAITGFGAMISLMIFSVYFGYEGLFFLSMWAGTALAFITSIYTAFLFAQAKGRDFWQSPVLTVHMFVHSILAGSAILLLISLFIDTDASIINLLQNALVGSIVANLLATFLELVTPHATADASKVNSMITKGIYRKEFWLGAMIVGNLIPLILALSGVSPLVIGASILSLIGLWFTEKIWVQAPQRIPLS
jgi:Fe-S-cluster-containing dehydrogenase component/formate-dependent nitrite reductase membrane component NrfD